MELDGPARSHCWNRLEDIYSHWRSCQLTRCTYRLQRYNRVWILHLLGEILRNQKGECAQESDFEQATHAATETMGTSRIEASEEAPTGGVIATHCRGVHIV